VKAFVKFKLLFVLDALLTREIFLVVQSQGTRFVYVKPVTKR